MINLPQHLPFVSSIMPSQNVPIQQTSQNFPITYQQPQTVTQQMQTTPSVAYPTNPQDSFKPFYQLHQADVFLANHQYQPNLQPPRNTYPSSFQPAPVQTQPNYGSLPQNILDQIRSCVSSAAPIFILPGGCHRQTGASNLNEGIAQHGTAQSTNANPFASFHCPPSFYPYPVPMPVLEPFGVQTRGKDGSRGCFSCCQRKQRGLDGKEYAVACCCDVHEQEEHRCTATNGDTICSKRDCPASISLQALASQFLSLPGIISCAATRLILRKIPGSNITSSTEDTMDKAIKCLETLNKEQLLAECKNAQHANALINLHMTTNPPVNIIPLLTLLQLKVNVLKAQVENLINKKVTECQGFGFEVETSGPIDPTVLSMKTNAELRQLLSALRQKECDERVNVNFSPYHSQKVIAECRLNNVQAKIRQVETEFDRRRDISVPGPTLASRIIRQFSESTCAFGFAHAGLFEPYAQGRMSDSPDPFARNPRRLALKPHEPGQRTVQWKEEDKAVATSENGTTTCRDAETGEDRVVRSKEKGVESKSSEDTCSCEESSSQESLDEGKKKLGLRIDRHGNMIVSSACCSRGVPLLKLASRIVEKMKQISGEDYAENEGEEAKGEGRESRDEEEDSVIEFRIKEIGVDGKEFEIITIDDDDEDTKNKTFDGGKASIKKERESDTDVGEKVGVGIEIGTLRKTDIEENSEGIEASVDAGFPIKQETESIERMIDSDYKDIKEEPAEKGESDQKRSTTAAGVEPKKETVVWGSDAKVKAKPKDYVLVTEKEIVRKPDNIESLGVTSSSKETAVEEEDDRALKEEAIAENVPIHQETVNQTIANRQQSRKSSFDLYKTLNYTVIAKPLSSNKQRKKLECVSDKNEVDYESQKKDRKRKNIQIVSTMTRVKYNKQFVDFWGWNNANERQIERDFSKSVDKENENDENDTCLLSKKEHSSMTRSDEQGELVSMVPTSTETNDDIEKNTLAEKMFPKSRRMNGEKMTNGLRRFPPLKHTYSNAAATTTAEISENLLRRKEIESNCSRIVCDRSSSYHCSSKMENGIVSVIYSMMESRFVSLNSLLGNIANFQGVLSNFHLNKSFNDTHDEDNLNSNRDDAKNKRLKSQKNNWIALPPNTNAYDDGEHDVSGGNRVSVGEQCINVHETRHSIIVDREKNDYLLIGGSVSGQSRELSRNGFKRPYHTRRSILIRSRLKSSGNSRHEYLRPFTIFKRLKGNKIVASQTGSQIQHRLKARQRFLALPGIPEDVETLSNGKHDNAFVTMNSASENVITQQNSKRNNCDAVTDCTALSIDRCSTEKHQVINGSLNGMVVNEQIQFE